jgi:hypothetical protein
MSRPKRAVVCEHGYQVDVVDRAVRHIATNGVCLELDGWYRALLDEAARVVSIEDLVDNAE